VDADRKQRRRDGNRKQDPSSAEVRSCEEARGDPNAAATECPRERLLQDPAVDDFLDDGSCGSGGDGNRVTDPRCRRHGVSA
jgi:hypothetical protein